MTQSEVERGFVRIAEGQVHYRSAGTPSDRPPIILLHASPASSRSLEGLLSALAPTRYAIAPDTLGNGQSPSPTQAAPSLADYADSMERMCDSFGFEQVDVYGTHTGAHIGIEWAIANPKRVRHLILDGVALLTEEERVDYLANYAPPQAPDPTGRQFHWAWNYMRDQMIFFPHYKKDGDHIRAGGVFDAQVLHDLTMDILGSLRTYHMAYDAVFSHDLAARVALVNVPSCCISSGHEYLAAGTKLLLENMPNVVKAEPDPQDGPPGLAAAINTFLAD